LLFWFGIGFFQLPVPDTCRALQQQWVRQRVPPREFCQEQQRLWEAWTLQVQEELRQLPLRWCLRPRPWQEEVEAYYESWLRWGWQQLQFWEDAAALWEPAPEWPAWWLKWSRARRWLDRFDRGCP
jgi:hypothetical protein